jgi:hypothetical protein
MKRTDRYLTRYLLRRPLSFLIQSSLDSTSSRFSSLASQDERYSSFVCNLGESFSATFFLW